ncbi:SLC13 family permease [Gordonia hongkongensis]|uniref:Sodium-dependent dicarboxylate transporter SdcS n=1 Tax=Gordonia hongkongensis TaxID=1701090 RepID=A0ABT6BTI9_9ACTN|nr:DASS family sodium-coupled anion symporter [Gordonia hongkongensis]MDF6101328.1 DASS family sodium-coupled anion symporter [Gordonia hongkongensis]
MVQRSGERPRDNRSESPGSAGRVSGSPDPQQDFDEIDHQSAGERADEVAPKTRRRQWIGLLAGVALAALVYAILPAEVGQGARLTAATAVLMGLWWMTEAIPIPATALLPLVIFPVFGSDDAGESISVNDVGAAYGNNVIFLFMGGFIIALAMQRWNLHRRIALVTVSAMGTKPPMVIAGFMIATGFLSMWVSNTATAVMMIPIGVSVLALVLDLGKDSGTDAPGPKATDTDEPVDGETLTQAVIKSNFGTALMLGIAYAASIGSLGTIIGTPPNTLLVGYLEGEGIDIGFLEWMIAGVPLAVIFLAIAWFLLTHVLFKPEIDDIPGGRRIIRDQLDALGSMSQGEIRVAAIFGLTALAWIAVPLIWDENPPISDTGIAMTAAVLLFLLPSGSKPGVRLLDWETAIKLPWGVLLLFGGGLALSQQFESSGLTAWIGDVAAGLDTIPVIVLVVIAATAIIFLTEITSNTATAATFLPVAGGVAMGMGLDPLVLTIPVALAATCAFMLPVATPPNAVAYASGYVTIGQMIRGGLWLNLIGIVLITLAAYTVFAWSLGIAY